MSFLLALLLTASTDKGEGKEIVRSLQVCLKRHDLGGFEAILAGLGQEPPVEVVKWLFRLAATTPEKRIYELCFDSLASFRSKEALQLYGRYAREQRRREFQVLAIRLLGKSEGDFAVPVPAPQ